ncbi:hypothetical protein RZN38_27675, partial [Klebsiella pneumoniae]|nr:hypothetical protein [Klebsiella pneumoniae]
THLNARQFLYGYSFSQAWSCDNKLRLPQTMAKPVNGHNNELPLLKSLITPNPMSKALTQTNWP